MYLPKEAFAGTETRTTWSQVCRQGWWQWMVRAISCNVSLCF